ncbi:MAG: pilus (MSHA type) biogenesis protein MshL [Burkholderiales bacterium RIFCSPHIGHO2_01_FULL_63_240]|nr:MAG: pilus (MSHA type) biogenesis protein MshL [Burkholderiales bacterium RIFCSPHIGHO2_01_FULL_63_240]
MIRTCILVMVSGALVCPPAGASTSTHPWHRSKSSLKGAPSMRVTHEALADIDWDRLPPTGAGVAPAEASSRMTLTLASLGPVHAPTQQVAQASASTAVPAAAPAPAPQARPAPLAPVAAPVVAPTVTPVYAASAAPAPRGFEPRFDLSVNNAPAAQVFLQLGVNTPYNILVSPEIAGNVTLSLKQTTVPEALETLRELFGYDFRMASGNRVFVYPNTVQTRLYKINYLPGRRQGASDLRVSSSSIGQSSGGGGTTTGTGSTSGSSGASLTRGQDTSSVRMTSDTDFWREVQDALNNLVGKEAGRNVTLNPGAGVIVVRATPAELRQVADYLRAIQLTIERQVMLEAKIVEIKLSKGSETGVNWTAFRGINSGSTKVGGIGMAPGVSLTNTGALKDANLTVTPGVSAAAEALGKGFYGLAFQSANFAALLSFLETQGDVKVLSSPRIATLNNQKAVLKVGSDELFVTGVSTTQTSTGSTTTSSPTLSLQPFFSGISLDVTPQIDDTGTVMLHVHPAISSVAEKEKVIDLGEMGSYRLPLAASSINETDSIVRVRDGQIVAIGGLMQQNSINDRSGVPGLSNIPGVGGLFRYQANSETKHELVILIKPTVIGEDGQGWPSADSALARFNEAQQN